MAVDNRVDTGGRMEAEDGKHGHMAAMADTDPSWNRMGATPAGQDARMAPEEMPMQWFIVEAANKPGEFARHAQEIAKRGINLINAISLGIGDRGGAAFSATDEAGLRSALNDAGIAYREVSVVAAQLEDRPGTVAEAARRLGDAGVNIELIAPLGMDGKKVTVGFGVDKTEEARKALGGLVTSGATAGATR
ncbi:MAG: hypothetical protein M3O77_06585 [Chloroflexota bacterium]|nr:hypothetical protein [Chloroflexota bacterium]